ncbi:MAG: LemA family protein [Erysipelotrichaceae bacterium]|nr:LemA family protein [Erysipelotrichaceae bacterium]
MDFLSSVPVWAWILAVVAIIALWFFSTYNSLVSFRTRVEEAFSGMDVTLTKRYDLIPNVVNTVKGYAKHESETLENVIKARSNAMSATTTEEKIAAQGELSQTLGRLFALSESYPDLKANQNFMDLQNQLKDIETEIASSRKFYNAVVRSYNIKVRSIPTNIVAALCHFKEFPPYVVTSEEQRQNVKVEF